MMNTTQHYDYIFRFLLRGNSEVGKTNFMLRYMDDAFYEQHITTIGVEFKSKIILSPDSSKSIKLQIWDTAGLERFKHVPGTTTSAYYRGAHGVIVLFDCTDRVSFKKVAEFFAEIDRLAHETAQKMLIATKIDLADKRQVSYEEAKQLADQLGVPYIETSAKNNININEAILTLTRNVELVFEKQPKRSVEKIPHSSPTIWSRCLIL